MHTLGRGRGGGASDTEFVFAKLLSIPGINFQLADSYDDPIIYTSSSGYKGGKSISQNRFLGFKIRLQIRALYAWGPGGGESTLNHSLTFFFQIFLF